jgi:Spy/CpxP family protein refolding chaperone
MMRTLAVVFVVLVVIAGIAAGVAIDRVWLLGGPPGGPPGGPHGGPPHGGPRGRPPVERFFEELTSELNLTAQQRDAIARVLDDAQRDARAIMEASRPALDAARDKTRARVLEVLTPEQRAKYEELEKKRPPPRMGPPDGPPHGGPPHGGPRHGGPPPPPP